MHTLELELWRIGEEKKKSQSALHKQNISRLHWWSKSKALCIIHRDALAFLPNHVHPTPADGKQVKPFPNA